MSVRATTYAQRLDARGNFDRPVRDPNGDITGWTRLASNVHMAVDGAKANERVANDGIRSVTAYTVWVRSDIVERFDIRQDDRITVGGEILNIKDAARQGLRGRLIPLGCDAGLNEG